jgi:hypothetical protein
MQSEVLVVGIILIILIVLISRCFGKTSVKFIPDYMTPYPRRRKPSHPVFTAVTHLFMYTKIVAFLLFCWPYVMIYPYNMNQQDALFTFNLFQ